MIVIDSKFNKIGIVLGWALFAVAISFWFETAIGESVSPAWLMGIIVAPIFEELVKYLGYRGLGGKLTIVIPVMFILAEYVVKTIMFSTHMDLMVFLFSVSASVFMLKHILFWVPERLFDFRISSLPIAISIHIAWNLWAASDLETDIIPAAFIALFCMFIPLLLFKLQRQQIWSSANPTG